MDPGERPRRDPVGLNVLVVDRSVPVSMTQGNELIARHLFRRLRQRHRLTFLAAIDPAAAVEGPPEEALAELFDVVHLVPRASRTPALAGALDPYLGRWPLVRGRRSLGPMSPAFGSRFRDALHALLAAERFDVIHTRQLPTAAYTARLPHPARLLELIDSETLAARRDLRGGPRQLARRAIATPLEGALASRFDVVTAVAEPDAEELRRLARGTRVVVVPNGVDADWFRPARADDERVPAAAVDANLSAGEQSGERSADAARSIAFVGAMSFPPNVDAARRFARDVLPLVRAQLPDAVLRIVGRDPTPGVTELGGMPGVDVVGSVPDVRPYLWGADVVVIPMVSGGGIKNKLLEAMATARPVVVTSLATGGAPVADGRELRIADGPRAFADTVVELLCDPAQRSRLARAAREFVVRRFSWDATADAYDRLYRELAGSAGANQDLRGALRTGT